MTPEDQEVQNLMVRAKNITTEVFGVAQDETVLAIYHELKKSKPVTFPRITKMWVERNSHDNGRGGINTDIYSRLLEVQLTEHCFKKVRIDWKTYELLGGKER
jgi:hypothetical protein